jgi:hypothetical protein
MAQDLSLLMPKPETREKTLMRERQGEISSTVPPVMARSSAKAKGWIEGILER